MPLITAEQLQEIAGDRHVELVRGEIVETSFPGMKHSVLAGRLLSLLGPFVRAAKLGIVGPELGVVLGRDPDTVRAPDVAFVAAGRISDPDQYGYYEGAPDLAVEILSPSDRPGEVLKKIGEYFAAGTSLVWVIDPRRQQVVVHHPDGRTQVYSGGQEVSGEDILPGFHFKPTELFS